MALDLDDRRRAMLAEMGIRVWLLKQPRATPVRPVTVETFAEPPVATSPMAVRNLGAMGWDDLEAAVKACEACELCAHRQQPVFGVGSRYADWMVIGDAPNQMEELDQQPFVEDRGILLDNMLAAIGLARNAELEASAKTVVSVSATDHKKAKRGVLVTHAVKCRPPGDRNPVQGEIDRCGAILRRQIDLVQPKLVLLVGRIAVRSVLQTDQPIGRSRAKAHPVQSTLAVVTYPPEHLIRHPEDKAKAWEDLCLAMNAAEREITR